MAYAKTSLRAEKRALREKMRAMGAGYREISAELTRRYKLRPRAAWREAYGWSLKEAAERINSRTGQAGLDPGGIASMTAPHLSEYENWPGFGPTPSGRRPTPYLLSLLAALYDCQVTLHAYLAGRLARTWSECGLHRAALDTADAAVRIAGSRAAPAVRSWLAVTRAFVHASLGEETACRNDLDDAARLLAAAGHDGVHAPGYIAFYGHGHLRKWTGHSMLALASSQPDLAAEGRSAVELALREWPSAALRESAELLAAAAGARLAQQEIGEAARLTRRAHAIALSTGSRRNMRAVRRLQTRLRPFGSIPAVRELDEQIRAGS